VSFGSEIKYYVHRQVAHSDYAIYKVRREGGDSYWWSTEKKEWVGPFKRFSAWQPDPVLTIEAESMKQFTEALSDMGFTPSDLASKSGELTATKEHLADMRRLVFEERIVVNEVRS
jgi:hypothetical protein